MSGDTSYKLYYFNGRGLGEVIRLTFEAKGQKFEDVRYTQETWPEAKKNFETGKLPCLEVNGKRIPQSKAILRYLGNEFGMFGDDNFERAMVDSMMENIRDMEQELYKLIMEKDQAKKEEIRNNFKTTVLPAFANLISGTLKQNKTGYLVGKKLSIADIHLFTFLDTVTRTDGFKDLLEENKDLSTHFDMVKSIPKIKAWLEKRPETPF